MPCPDKTFSPTDLIHPWFHSSQPTGSLTFQVLTVCLLTWRSFLHPCSSATKLFTLSHSQKHDLPCHIFVHLDWGFLQLMSSLTEGLLLAVWNSHWWIQGGLVRCFIGVAMLTLRHLTKRCHRARLNNSVHLSIVLWFLCHLCNSSSSRCCFHFLPVFC